MGAGAERHADEGDAGVSTGAKVMGARGDRVGGGSKPPAVAPLVHRPLAWSAWRRLREGAIVLGFRGGRPVVWVRKGWKKDKDTVLVWRDSGVGVGGIVSEQRCLLSEHPQKMHVTLSSIFRLVKTVLSFCKSRVFSRTRFLF